MKDGESDLMNRLQVQSRVEYIEDPRQIYLSMTARSHCTFYLSKTYTSKIPVILYKINGR